MIPDILTPNTQVHDQLYKYSKSWLLSSMGFIIIDLEIKRHTKYLNTQNAIELVHRLKNEFRNTFK